MYALHLSFIMHKIHLQGSKKPKTETISWWPWVLSGVTFAFPCCIPHHYNSSCYQNAPPNDHQWSCSPLHINYIPDLHSAICKYLDHCMSGMSHDIIGWRCTLPDSSLPSDRIQIWTKVLIQISNYISWPLACRSCSNYNSSPSQECSHGLYTSAIFSPTSASDWPFQVLNATYILYAIDQLIFKHWLTVFQATLSLDFDFFFCMLGTDQFLIFIWHFYITNPPAGQMMDAGTARLHLLKHATRNNREHVGEVLPLPHLWSPVHLIPYLGPQQIWLSNKTSYELSTEFWLNHYWNQESIIAFICTSSATGNVNQWRPVM